MNNEKNTQNAVVLTKDARQYKHTPNKRKRLVGKIFALVGCLAVLLSCLALPSSADMTALDTSSYSRSPYLPNTISVPYYGDEDDLCYLTTTFPIVGAHNGRGLNWTSSYNYDYGMTTDCYYQYIQENNRYIVSAEFLDTNLQFDDHNTPVVIEYLPFYYNPDAFEYLPSDVSTPERGTVCYFEFVSNSSFMTIRTTYHLEYTLVSTGETLTATATSTSANLDSHIGLANFFDYVGISGYDFYVNSLRIEMKASTADDYVYLLGYSIYTPVEYEFFDYPVVDRQIINSGSASSFVEFLEDVVSDFLGLNLFTFGSVNVTPGAILSVFGGVAILLWLLKLFLGG